MSCVHQLAYDTLMESDSLRKCQLVRELFTAWFAGECEYEKSSFHIKKIKQAGRPLKPDLVSPESLPKRSLHTNDGRTIFMHAIAHIEFNAINLAIDAVYRFRGQPKAFYEDWLKVADDEARHFQLVSAYLKEHGSFYGEFDAHNGLWEMTEKTDHDILHRMALVPRVLEARGLDVSPAMIEKLKQAKDERAAEILSTIYHDEITHVEAGSRWFFYHCEQQSIYPESAFINIINQYIPGKLKGPFNERARLLAGFKESELMKLKGLV